MELVGTEVKKNFKGFGLFTGTVQSYDAAAGFFKIQYEDGDSEEVDFEEMSSILKEMGGSSPKLDHSVRKSNRGRPPKKRQRFDESSTVNLEKSELDETPGSRAVRRSARRAWKRENALVSEDDDLGGVGKELISVKPELPPSSKDLDIDGLNVFDLFSVYTCLRSFSRLLFLSPFKLETFIAGLRCNYANFLIDSIHFSILQALKPHLESLAEEGSQSASDCLRYLNWGYLDLVTWPVFLIYYLVINRPQMKPGFRLSQMKLLDSEYYELPAAVKLEILRCLCDDVIEVNTIRSDINRRMSSEINVDAPPVNVNVGKKRKSSASIDPADEEGSEEVDDGNFDECCLCGMDGSLICCDGCPAAFHSKCVGVAKDLLPEGEWYCPECMAERSNGAIKSSKPSSGAELLGIDPHGRLYFGICDRLLVSDSCEPDASFHYYNKDDLDAVTTVLKSCYSYNAILNSISMYFGFPIGASVVTNQSGYGILYDGKENLEAQVHNELPLSSGHSVLNDVDAEKLPLENSFSSENCAPKGSQHSDLGHLNPVVSSCFEPFDEKVDTTTCIEMPQQTASDFPTDLVDPSLEVVSLNNTDLPAASDKCNGFPGWGNITDRKKGAHSVLQSDPDNYSNCYSFGRIASLVFAEFVRKSSEEKSNDPKKPTEDIKSTQLKAISNQSKECWFAYQKLSTDAQKENCGWCFSCRASDNFDCLFKVAINKNLEAPKDKDLKRSKNRDHEDSKIRTVGPSSQKNEKNHIIFAVHHILSIEHRARSLLSGPWQKAHYSEHWRKTVMKASDVASLKPLLLALESNLRRVAFLGEWSRSMDDARSIASASIVTSPVHVSSNYVGSRKRGRKSISTDELSIMSRHAKISDICWWRGGRLSRQLFQCKVLPRGLASKGGRQAGFGKIPHMLYPDNSDFAKRSKYVAWRGAVEMSQTVAQLVYQVKDFDSSIKWSELSSTRLFPKLAKEPKKIARQMRNVTICGKSKEGKQMKYLLDFGKRETVPPIVMKHGVLLEESSIGRKRYWLSEAHVPLHLLKSYEEKKMKKRTARLLKKIDSGMHHVKDSGEQNMKEPKCKMKKRKKSEWHSYLISKEQETETQVCGHCNKDVLVREAVNCQLCSGFFHRKHFRVPKGVVTTSYTCNRCKDARTMSGKDKQRKTEKSKEDTTNVKTKEENINSRNLIDREISTVNVTAKGKRSVMLKKEITSKIVGDKDKKSMKVEKSCRRSERVRQKSIGNGKLKSQGHKQVSKKRKIPEGKMVEAKEDKGKHVVTKIKIKFNGPKRSEEGISERTRAKIKFNGPKRSKEDKSESAKSEKYGNGISWHKRKRSVVRFSYWLNGLLWTHKAVTEQQSDFKERNVILPFQQDLITTPCCCLCHQEYNSGVIYISCERCQGWFHGDIFGLTVENINHLIGFLCHNCRMRDEPVCPFSDGMIGGAELDRKYEIGMNVICNEGQNDVDQQYGDPILCKEGYSDEDCLARVQSKDRLDKLQRENVPEEELGLSSNAKLTNGHLADLQQKNKFGEFRNCVREASPAIVQSQDHMDETQREDVTLHEEEPSLCPKSVSENLDNVHLPQVEEAYISSTKNESVVEVGVALPEAREELYGMIEIPDPGIEVGIHSDSIKFDPQITLPALNLDDADRVMG